MKKYKCKGCGKEIKEVHYQEETDYLQDGILYADGTREENSPMEATYVVFCGGCGTDLCSGSYPTDWEEVMQQALEEGTVEVL